MSVYECPVCLGLEHIILANGQQVPCPACRPVDHDDTERDNLLDLAGRQHHATWAEDNNPEAYTWEAA